MVPRNRLTERYLEIVTDSSSFPISQPFPDLFGNDGKSASAEKYTDIIGPIVGDNDI